MSENWTALDAARGDGAREWELFVREGSADPLTHVGSVTGESAAAARERAERLFGWRAAAFWLCPADETRRFTAPDLTLGRGESPDADDAESGG